jgi:hypothetical protein
VVVALGLGNSAAHPHGAVTPTREDDLAVGTSVAGGLGLTGERARQGCRDQPPPRLMAIIGSYAKLHAKHAGQFGSTPGAGTKGEAVFTKFMTRGMLDCLAFLHICLAMKVTSTVAIGPTQVMPTGIRQLEDELDFRGE